MSHNERGSIFVRPVKVVRHCYRGSGRHIHYSVRKSHLTRHAFDQLPDDERAALVGGPEPVEFSAAGDLQVLAAQVAEQINGALSLRGTKGLTTQRRAEIEDGRKELLELADRVLHRSSRHARALHSRVESKPDQVAPPFLCETCAVDRYTIFVGDAVLTISIEETKRWCCFWQYEENSSTDFWLEPSTDLNVTVETDFLAQHGRGKSTCQLGYRSYQYDFGEMTQTNMHSKRSRPVRRLRPLGLPAENQQAALASGAGAAPVAGGGAAAAAAIAAGGAGGEGGDENNSDEPQQQNNGGLGESEPTHVSDGEEENDSSNNNNNNNGNTENNLLACDLLSSPSQRQRAAALPLIKSDDALLEVDWTSRLGVGGTAVVFAATWGATQCVLKKFHEHLLGDASVLREIAVAPSLKHPNICRTLARVENSERPGEPYGLLLELLTPLSHVDPLDYSLSDRLACCVDAAQSLVFLHVLRIVHCDFSASNLLIKFDSDASQEAASGAAASSSSAPASVSSSAPASESAPAPPEQQQQQQQQQESTGQKQKTKNFSLVLADFGSAHLAVTNETNSGRALCHAYCLCPHLAAGDVVASPASDVFAFAWLIYDLVTGAFVKNLDGTNRDDHGFGDKTPLQIMRMIDRGYRPRLPVASFPSAALRHLVEDCWQDDVKLRPSIHEVVAQLQEIIESLRNNNNNNDGNQLQLQESSASPGGVAGGGAASSSSPSSRSPSSSSCPRANADGLWRIVEGGEQVASELARQNWTLRDRVYYSDSITDRNSPLFQFVLRQTRCTELPPESLFHFNDLVTRIVFTEHATNAAVWTTVHESDGASREANPFLRPRYEDDDDTQAGLAFLRSLYSEKPPQEAGRENLSHVMFGWHAGNVKILECIARDGARALRSTDAGFFGGHTYFSAEAGYTARYARMSPPLEETGEHGTILFALSVSETYVVTLGRDYRTAEEDAAAPANVRGHSKFYSGDPAVSVTLLPKFDAHWAPVRHYGKRSPITGEELGIDVQYQCCPEQRASSGGGDDGAGDGSETAAPEAHEIVLLHYLRANPVAIVYFRDPPAVASQE